MHFGSTVETKIANWLCVSTMYGPILVPCVFWLNYFAVCLYASLSVKKCNGTSCSSGFAVLLVLLLLWPAVTLFSEAPFTRYNRLSNRLSNWFDNRLYRVNGVWQYHTQQPTLRSNLGMSTALKNYNTLKYRVFQPGKPHSFVPLHVTNFEPFRHRIALFASKFLTKITFYANERKVCVNGLNILC